ALGAANYESSHKAFPPGLMYYNVYLGQAIGWGPIIRILPFIEQSAVYSAINHDVGPFDGQGRNLTIAATGISALWCPSDPSVANSSPSLVATYGSPASLKAQFRQYFSSYGGVAGPWYTVSFMFNMSDGNVSPVPDAYNNNLGTIFFYSRVSASSVTDGLSNTMVFTENGHGFLDASTQPNYHLWNSGSPPDSAIHTMYGPNPQKKYAKLMTSSTSLVKSLAQSAMSFHPGGVNAAFLDGSVRFLKDSIDSWPIDPATGLPKGVTKVAPYSTYALDASSRFGVFQALSTRSGGEVISADQY
uniref:DUF1559 family PulG-like putative transporter n=1 Tax=Aquisphaera insulae TaxID=2712864 RepID=UPI0013EC3A85